MNSGAHKEGAAPAVALVERLQAALGERARALPRRDGMATFEVPPGEWRECARVLRERCGFAQATLVTALDHYPRIPRFELVLQLVSIPSAERVRLVTSLTGERPTAQSVIALFPGAAFMERECHDLFGIDFEGHAGLKRLLMPEGYRHHPLRKDFPHQGLEPDRLYREWDSARRAAAGAAGDGGAP